MMGKVVGIGLVGLTQFVIWVVLTSVISSFGLAGYQKTLLEQQMSTMGVSTTNGTIEAPNISAAGVMEGAAKNETLEFLYSIPWVDVVISFIIFFIGGYLLYASLFAAIGAMVDSETDTQQFMMPVTIPLVFGYIVSVMMINNPEGNIGTIFSVVPFTSPIVMMVKTAIGVSIWLKLLSIVVLGITFFFFIWLAGRIYRVGILMYGKKPTYREIYKWIKYQ